MANEHTCPDCGAPMAQSQKLRGLCPKCLLKIGLGLEEADREMLGPYEILGEIGRGGMGRVYRAYERSLNRIVALKVLPKELTSNASYLKRFQREAQTAASLHHPNIVPIHAIGEADGVWYFAMEYIRGKNLAEYVKSEELLRPRQVVNIISQCARALDVAHKAGILHRDIKPQNIMIDRTGRVRIMDFGVAKRIDSEVSEKTIEGAFLGTLRYASPEQCAGELLDERSDLYALGIIFYELLTGKVPFESDSTLQMLRQKILGENRFLAEDRPDLAPALIRIVDRLLSSEPEGRIATADLLIEELDALEGVDLTPGVSGADQTSGVGRPFPARLLQSGAKGFFIQKQSLAFFQHRLFILVGLLIAAGLFINGAVMLYAAIRSVEEPEVFKAEEFPEADIEMGTWHKVEEPIPWEPVIGHATVVFKDKIWILGGLKSEKNNNEVWNSPDGVHWTSVTLNAPWAKRHGLSCLVFQDALWVLGGRGNGFQNDFRDVWRSDNGKDWTQITDKLPWGTTLSTKMTVHEGQIWLIGPDQIWKSSDGATWEKVADAYSWPKRSPMLTASHNGEIWMFGGHVYQDQVYDSWSSPDGKRWVKRSENVPWENLQRTTTGHTDNGFWLLSGVNHHDSWASNSKDIQMVWYSGDGLNWSKMPDGPWPPRRAGGVVEFKGKLWLIGGGRMGSENNFNDVWWCELRDKEQ